MLAKLLVIQGDVDGALRYTAEGVKYSTRLLLPLARIYALKGAKAEAKDAATQARAACEMEAKADQTSVDARLRWAECEAFLGHFAKAEEVLLEGLDFSFSDRYRDLLGAFYIQWLTSLDRSREATIRDRLEVLDRAVRFGGANESFLMNLATLSVGGGDEAEKAKQVLSRSMSASTPPLVRHRVLGTQTLLVGSFAESLLHLEEAHELQPDDWIVMNNLAWVWPTRSRRSSSAPWRWPTRLSKRLLAIP